MGKMIKNGQIAWVLSLSWPSHHRLSYRTSKLTKCPGNTTYEIIRTKQELVITRPDTLNNVKVELKRLNNHCPNITTHHLQDMWLWYDEQSNSIFFKLGYHWSLGKLHLVWLTAIYSLYICIITNSWRIHLRYHKHQVANETRSDLVDSLQDLIPV